MTIGKFIGCVLMVVGSAIGAGALAMPIQIAGGGFVWSAITILIAWIILTITGLLVIEVSLALPAQSCSFASMATKTLGVPGKLLLGSPIYYYFVQYYVLMWQGSLR